MNKSSWRQVEQGLRSLKTPPPLNDLKSFTQDFKARTTLMRQDPPPEERRAISFSLLNRRYVGAVVAILLMIGLFILPSSSSRVTQVKSLQVYAPHSGVIIMTDEDNPGTVVWVTDMESNDENKG